MSAGRAGGRRRGSGCEQRAERPAGVVARRGRGAGAGRGARAQPGPAARAVPRAQLDRAGADAARARRRAALQS